jgi:hypothetical protein
MTDEVPELEVDWQLPDGQDDDEQLPEPPEEPETTALESDEPPAQAPRFSYNDRMYALGYSTSGKSELLNVIFSGLRCQRLLIDNKPEFTIPELEPVHTPEAIDWTQPLIHYQPAPGSDHTQYEEIFAAAFTRRGLCACVHEFGALVAYNANRAGPYLISYLSQGARLGLGGLFGAQRLAYVPVPGKTEANHVTMFVPQLALKDDNDAAAELFSPVDGAPLSRQELLAELAELQRESGPYSFLWKDRSAQTLTSFPALPHNLRSQSIVNRLDEGG